MFRTNVVKKWYQVTLENEIGEKSTFRIESESEENARLMCNQDGWNVVSILLVRK